MFKAIPEALQTVTDTTIEGRRHGVVHKEMNLALAWVRQIEAIHLGGGETTTMTVGVIPMIRALNREEIGNARIRAQKWS